ncbi:MULTISPECIES: hypothetical protein [Deinococcus]|uniref:Uncharacterized protein n=1 Tax=Deinococcus rufus TaxID=2136097 RepID=A0ABV7Z5J6_9DEIO|nr:hypothetical protein [Deinococcus sp. AB2017081]WQE95053.1 hypothetical protein U2P90_16945 [Deinococcus sp. AB2017081]
MTERTGGRAQDVLRTIGMDETPVSVLEREDALFVLTPQTLVYQDGGGTRRVTLRDLTRIHSDEQGVLRVETPAGTALTATLLGFDVTQVQAFFVQVRDTTARAKEQPTSPLPTAGGLKTFAPVPPTPEPAPAPRAPAPETAPAPAAVNAAPAATATPPQAPRREPTAPTPPRAPEPARPVVISSSAFTPSAARTPAPQPEPARMPERVAEPVRAAAPPATARPVPPSPAPTSPAVARPEATSPAAITPAPAATPAPVTPAAPPASPLEALLRQAEVVDALTGRLRFLGGVLFVAALALAAVQYLNGARLDGLWTLLSGGVGTIALLALADVARLLALGARQTAQRRDDGRDA